MTALACAVALVSAAAPAAAAPPSDEGTVEARLEINTSLAGGDPAVLARRLEERANIVLRHAKVLSGDDDDVALAIVVRELGDEEPGYLIRFELRAADGALLMEEKLVECELCTETELVARVETELQPVLTVLREAAIAAQSEPEESAQPEGPEPGPTDEPAARGSTGLLAGGIACLVLGGSSLAAGVGLAIPDPKIDQDDPLDLITTRPPGYAMIAGGAALAIVGAALTAVAVKRRRSQPSVSVVPQFSRSYAGVMLDWRLP